MVDDRFNGMKPVWNNNAPAKRRATRIGLIILSMALLSPAMVMAQYEGELHSTSFWVRMFTVNNGGRHEMTSPAYNTSGCLGETSGSTLSSPSFQTLSGFCAQSYWFLTEGSLNTIIFPELVIGNSLAPPAPNPATAPLSIGFAVKADDVAKISVYDVTGRLVKTLVDRVSGPYSQSVTWKLDDDNGRPVAAGVYFARLETKSSKITRQIVLLGH